MSMIDVGIAEAGVKLDRHLLTVGDFERRQHQIIVERLVREADFALRGPPDP